MLTIITDLSDVDERLSVLTELRVPAVLAGRPRADHRAPAVLGSDAATAVGSVVDDPVTVGHRRITRIAGLRPSSTPTHGPTRSAPRCSRADDVLVTDYSWKEGRRRHERWSPRSMESRRATTKMRPAISCPVGAPDPRRAGSRCRPRSLPSFAALADRAETSRSDAHLVQ